jgi:hypothetical protein
MNIEIEGLETGITMIRLTYLNHTYTTGCFFAEEAGEKIQLLINAALEKEKQKENGTKNSS